MWFEVQGHVHNREFGQKRKQEGGRTSSSSEQRFSEAVLICTHLSNGSTWGVVGVCRLLRFMHVLESISKSEQLELRVAVSGTLLLIAICTY